MHPPPVEAKSRSLRELLGMSRVAWSRALGVHERTVIRWEDGDVDPAGLPREVMKAIALALERRAMPEVKRILEMGISTALYFGLTLIAPTPAKRRT